MLEDMDYAVSYLQNIRVRVRSTLLLAGLHRAVHHADTTRSCGSIPMLSCNTEWATRAKK